MTLCKVLKSVRQKFSFFFPLWAAPSKVPHVTFKLIFEEAWFVHLIFVKEVVTKNYKDIDSLILILNMRVEVVLLNDTHIALQFQTLSSMWNLLNI